MMVYSMEQNAFLEPIPEETQELELLDFKAFKTTVLSMHKELQENKDKEVKEIRETIYEQNKNVNRDRNDRKEPNRNSGTEKYRN